MDGASNVTMAHVSSSAVSNELFSWFPVAMALLVFAGLFLYQRMLAEGWLENLPGVGKVASWRALAWQSRLQCIFGVASLIVWVAMRSGDLGGTATCGDWTFFAFFCIALSALMSSTLIGVRHSVAMANKAWDASIVHFLRDGDCSVSSDMSTESASNSSSESGLLDAPKGKRHRKRRSMARAQRRRSRRPSFLPPLHYHTGGSSDESFSSRSKFLRRRDTGAPSAPSHLMQCPHSLSQGPPGPPLPYGWGGVYSGTQGNSYGAMPPLYGPLCPRTADEPKKNTQ